MILRKKFDRSDDLDALLRHAKGYAEHMMGAWQNTPREKRVTHHGRGPYPDATFDGFLTKGVKVLSSEVRDGISASDRNPVVLKISLP